MTYTAEANVTLAENDADFKAESPFVHRILRAS